MHCSLSSMHFCYAEFMDIKGIVLHYDKIIKFILYFQQIVIFVLKNNLTVLKKCMNLYKNNCMNY